MLGTITNKKAISAYQPKTEVIEVTKKFKDNYQQGIDIITKPWVELNDRSVIDDMNRGQRMFNAYVDTSIEDPNEAWKWRGTRSKARNKAISMHAQLTSNYLLPLFLAQNENDEIDRDFSEVMRDIAEWLAQPCNSNYQSQFLQIVFSMMYNPVTYLGAEYCEVYQKIKDKTEDGKYEVKEILDEVLSGFNASIWGATEVLITNPYERNIQKQRVIIKRRYTEYSELEAKYSEHSNWPLVQKGIKSIYSEEDGLFYDVRDEDHPNLVAEEIELNRQEDTEIPMINGIYMGDDDVNANCIKHRDNFNAPKYNVIPFGYMRINDHFAYYKSMMNALQWDNMAYDAMSEIVFNRAVLENEMPIAVSGTDKVDSSVIFPNAVVPFEDKDTKITPLLPQSNIIQGFNALRETENSIDQGSINETMSGQLPDANQKAYNVAQAQANAKKNIGAIGKSLAESMVMYGDLMKDIIINHITAPQIEELTGGVMKMKYRTLVFNSKVDGEKILKFDNDLIGLKLTDKEKTKRNVGLYEKIKGVKNKVLRLINPEMFAKFKYLTKIDIEEMFTKSNEYMQPLLTALKAQLVQDPYVDQEKLTKKLLQSYFNSEAEDLMKDTDVLKQQILQQTKPNNQITNQMTAKAVANQM